MQLDKQDKALIVLIYAIALTALAAVVAWSHLARADSGAPDSEIPEFKGERAFGINGLIGGGNTTPIGMLMLKAAMQSKEPIELVINSPGGSLHTGERFIQYMEEVRKQGVEIRCFVLDHAMSMAFMILMHCDKRYASPNSQLMFHPVRIYGGAIGQDEALLIHKRLKQLNQGLLEELEKALTPVSFREVRRAFWTERFWDAAELEKASRGEFIKTARVIPGLLPKLLVKEIPINPPFDPRLAQ